MNLGMLLNSIHVLMMFGINGKLSLEICDIHAPHVNIRSKGYTAPWVTGEYLHLSKERDFQRLKAHKENSESAWLLYRETRNKVNNLAKTLKRKLAVRSIIVKIILSNCGKH